MTDTRSLKLKIRVAAQKADLLSDGLLVKTYAISTALNGLGCEPGSGKTPIGRLVVAEKIGADQALGSVFKARVPTGQVWANAAGNPLRDSIEDLVLTRILWLDGLDPYNSGTLERYIYLHGTNQEGLLGQSVSHGCVRFANADIIELFDRVAVGTEVEVVG